MQPFPNQTYITLNDGHKIPQFGLGVYQVEGDEKTKEACLKALKIGYRHIDTAHAYLNERGVGEALKESGIPRKEIWVTSKLWPNEYGEGATLQGIDKMLKRLQTDYIDLLLLHQPFGDYFGAWKDMEKAVAQGKVKSIGLSNFYDDRLEQVLTAAKIKPSVMQVEYHPYFTQEKLIARVSEYGTKIESWYPIGHGDKALIEEEVFTKLGKKYNKTSVQIILRWHIQKGIIVFPKTTNEAHMKDNINIFDFALTEEEMKEIQKVNKNTKYFNVPMDQLEGMLSKYSPQD